MLGEFGKSVQLEEKMDANDVTLTPYLKFCKREDSLFLININFWSTFLQLHFFKTDTFQGHALLSPYRRKMGKYELKINRNAFIS